MTTRHAILLANATLLSAWLWVHGATLAWVVETLGRPDSELNLALAGALALLALWHADFPAIAARLGKAPNANRIAAALVLVGAMAASADLSTLQPVRACFAGVSAYGLLGCYVPRETWVRARPAVALGVLLMPMAAYLDVYLGFPARRLTSEAVALLLTAMNIPHVTSGVVLTLEGGAAYVDLPCAGIKSLWTGAVFLLGAALLEGRTIDIRFLAVSVLATGLLLVANTARVATIVLLDFVAKQPLIAEVLHAPLGVMGFVLCCGTAWAMLTMGNPPGTASRAPSQSPGSTTSPVVWALIPVLLLVGIPSSPVANAATAPTAVGTPPGLVAIPLTEAEALFAQDQGGAITKVRFAQGALTGTVVMVRSHSWTAQHLPRHCLQAAGVEVSGEVPTLVADEPLRWADVTVNGKSGVAAWWFQSADRITDDHTERIWAGLGDPQPWTMVSVLIEQPIAPTHTDLTALITALRTHLSDPRESP